MFFSCIESEKKEEWGPDTTTMQIISLEYIKY